MGMTPEQVETIEKLLEEYNRRCVMCWGEAVTIHEIIPRSKAPRTWDRDDNKVALCNDCHEKIHRKGAMNFVDELKERRGIALGIDFE